VDERKVFYPPHSLFPDSPVYVQTAGFFISIAQAGISTETGQGRPASLRTDLTVYSLFAAVFGFRLLYAPFFDLLPDEAYYWDWSRQLSFGYFDHPPLVAWLIAVSRALFGDTITGVRFSMSAAALMASVVSYLLVKKYVSGHFALVSWAVLSNAVLIFGVGAMLATPDIPQVLFWSLALWAGYHAIFETKSRWWLLLGALCGLGMLSKYTFALFPISMFLFLVLSRERRVWFLRRHPWVAGAVGLLVWMPNLLWNQRHHWQTILYQLHHGVETRAALHLDFLGEFVGGQIAILSLVPAALIGYAAWAVMKNKTDRARTWYLTSFLLVPFCFFLLSSLQKRVEANWPAAAYVSGMMLVPIAIERIASKKIPFLRRFTILSLVFATLTTAILLVQVVHPIVHLPPQSDPVAQSHGWRSLAHAVDSVRIRIDPERHRPLCALRYQEAALLAFYLPDHPKTFTVNFGSRDNQYSLWPERRPPSPAEVIFLHPADDPHLDALCGRDFLMYGLLTKVTMERGPADTESWAVIIGSLR
jgi:hypothetical protein